MLEKILEKKILWIILISIVIILIVTLFVVSKKNNQDNEYIYEEEVIDNIIFQLNGMEEVDVYLNEEYEELGVNALIDDGTDLSEFVKINGNVDVTTLGTYEVKYYLKYNNINKELTRKVNIIDVDSNDIELRLIGDEIVYLNINEEYEEFGAEAVYKDLDLSDKIEIEGNVDTTCEGEYNIIYRIKEKEIERKVIVFDIDNMFNYNEKNKEIEVELNESIIYIRMPNGLLSSDKKSSYKVNKAGIYEFTLFTQDDKEYKKIVTLTNKEVSKYDIPSGTCEAILKDGKTTVTVSTLSEIKKYIYNGYESDSNVYYVSKYLRDAKVILEGVNGKTTELKCNIKMETLPVKAPIKGSKVIHTGNTDTLKTKIVTYNGIYLAYVWVYDVSRQLVKYYGNDVTYKVIQKAVNNLNLQDQLIVGANMGIGLGPTSKSVHKSNPDYYKKERNSLRINQGVIETNDPTIGWPYYLYYIDGSNQLKFLPKKINEYTRDERAKLYQEVIDSGAQTTFTWRPVLVDNYKTVSLSKDFLKQEAAAQYKQALCQLDSNNFIIASSIHKSSGPHGKKTYPEFQKYLVKLGCKTAVEFDAGGSASLAWKPKNTSKVKNISGTRVLQSFGFFKEL